MKKQTKTETVRTLLAAGDLTPAQIAKKVGVSKSYVYNVRLKLAKKGNMRPLTAHENTEVKGKVSIPNEGARMSGKGSNGHAKRITPIDFSMANRLDPCQHNIVEFVATFRDEGRGGIAALKEARNLIDALISYEQT
jgi:hypothetical protein